MAKSVFISIICCLLYPLVPCSFPSFYPALSQVSVVNALDMQVVVSTVPPTLTEEKKEELIR